MKSSVLKALKAISTHHYVHALQKSLMSVVGVSFIAGLLLIIQNPPVSSISNGEFIRVDWVNFAADNAGLLSLGVQMTLGMIGLYTLIAFIIHLAHHYKMNPFHPVLSGVSAYLILSVGFVVQGSGLDLDLKYLGYSGIFGAFILGILVVEVSRLSIYVRSKINIKSEVSSHLIQPLESSLSTLLIILFALALRFWFQQQNILLPDLILKAILPLLKESNTLWFVMGVILFSKLLWFVGLNGNSLILVSLIPLMLINNAQNLVAYQNDMAIPYIISTGFLFFELGVLPLATAILLFSKNKQQKGSARLGILPALFNFQETILTGLPLTFNVNYLIPYLLTSVLSLSVSYLAMANFLISKPLFAMSFALPGFLGAFLSTMDWKAIVLWMLLYGLCTLIYWPFIREIERIEPAVQDEHLNNT